MNFLCVPHTSFPTSCGFGGGLHNLLGAIRDYTLRALLTDPAKCPDEITPPRDPSFSTVFFLKPGKFSLFLLLPPLTLSTHLCVSTSLCVSVSCLSPHSKPLICFKGRSPEMETFRFLLEGGQRQKGILATAPVPTAGSAEIFTARSSHSSNHYEKALANVSL